MSWYDLAFPSDAGFECKHSAEMLGMEDVYESDTDLSPEWKEVDQDFECDILLSDYQMYDEETAALMTLDDETLYYMFTEDPVSVPQVEMLPVYDDAWDDEWFWSCREDHIDSWAAYKQHHWERTHTPKPKFVRPTIAIVPKPQPVVISVAATTAKEVKPVPEIKQPMFDPKSTFMFKTGVVIKMNYTDGEMMHRNGEYRKAFNSRQTADFLERGFQFETKHEVLYKPQ